MYSPHQKLDKRNAITAPASFFQIRVPPVNVRTSKTTAPTDRPFPKPDKQNMIVTSSFLVQSMKQMNLRPLPKPDRRNEIVTPTSVAQMPTTSCNVNTAVTNTPVTAAPFYPPPAQPVYTEDLTDDSFAVLIRYMDAWLRDQD